MTDKAIITRRGLSRTADSIASEIIEVQGLGISIERQLPQGLLVSAEEQQLASLDAMNYRVKLLPDTNILQVGAYRIDIETDPPVVPSELQVPASLEQTWQHHLVQLASPPNQEWTQVIEAQGVEVVEPIGSYGLFVVGNPEVVHRLRDLPFVEWTGPFQPAYRVHPNLSEREGRIQYVNIRVYPEEHVEVVKSTLTEVGGTIVREATPKADYQGDYTTLIVEIEAEHLNRLAQLPGVRWLEYASPRPGYDGERETQIVAENLNAVAPPNTAPVTGYQAWLTNLGLSGTGTTIAICDSGVDANANNNTVGHLDLRGRQVAFVDYTGGRDATDTDGHGTHVAGIAVGNAATAQTEGVAPNNFLWGQGMAPQANYVTQNATSLSAPWPPADFANLTQDALNNGAQIMNNSWWDLDGVGVGYTANARTFDQLVRDPNPGTATLEDLIIVFSAGNRGPNASTITSPKEAKNLIVVGNSLTFRPGVGDVDDISGLRRSSSRGPALDGRILPTVVAPGTNVSSTWSETGDTVFYGAPIAGTGTPDPANPANRLNEYMFMSGTSMSASHVSGACALLTEWWRERTGGKNPSPALLKALLINGAEDLAGGPSGRTNAAGNPIPLTNIPNNDQGWGRVSLENILLLPPDSDRGPKIFLDQRHAFTADAQEYTIRVAPVDTTRPLRITLVWTDVHGAPGANPALVNDLDLEVQELGTGNLFCGNNFVNGFSTPGDVADNRNNVECVYVEHPSGTYEVTVIASDLRRNARPPFDVATPWQDFALVIDNAEVPAAEPVSVVPVIDRSGSMQTSGYVDVTRTSSKQFVDLMNIDDQLGVASFGSTGTIEYPTGADPTLQSITGQPIREAANEAIDDISFGGCTYMGDGIIKARDLLSPATGSRAMVLFSDGYDNKGCDRSNPTKPSALDAAGSLPANMPVYTCAMGPASDQALLDQIADVTNGRYYYMPTIDDLFEIHNYIRGQVTGDGIIVNESTTASKSRVGGYVDSLATRVTFSVAWADTALRYVSREPEGRNEISVRLRDPRGRLLHPNTSYVRRVEGEGYVIFEIQEPLAGQWYVEVETSRQTHTRFTVGGFVQSPIKLDVSLVRKYFIAGMPLTYAVRVFDNQRLVKGLRVDSRILYPDFSIPGLLKQYAARLRQIQPIFGADKMPRHIAKLITLRNQMLIEQKQDIFAHKMTRVRLRNLSMLDLRQHGLEHLTRPNLLRAELLQPSITEALTENTSSVVNSSILSRDLPQPISTVTSSIISSNLVLNSGILLGQLKETQEKGSYNIIVSVTGTSQISNTRFSRKELVSVLVK